MARSQIPGLRHGRQLHTMVDPVHDVVVWEGEQGYIHGRSDI